MMVGVADLGRIQSGHLSRLLGSERGWVLIISLQIIPLFEKIFKGLGLNSANTYECR